MKDKLSDALDHISDAHIAEAARPRRRRPYWIGAVAALLAVAILVGIFHPSAQSPDGSAVQSPDNSVFLVSAAEYPQMAPYPDETEYIGADGTFDSDAFMAVYEAWWDDQKAQYDQPEGYADSLTDFFAAGIPVFLAGDTENAVCSPLNIYMALAMLAETTDGNSRQQILDLLNCGSIQTLRTQAGQVWNAHYCADGATATVLANALWLDQGMTYNDDAVSILAKDYYASVYQGDLGSEAMNAALRNWLNEQTGDLLREQVQDVELSPETALALTSAIYYRVKWDNEFWEENNTAGVFHTPGGDADVTYMNKCISYGPYFWGEDFAAAYLTLEDGGRMWLILPDEGKTPADVLESGQALEMALGDWSSYENQKAMQVNLSVPKFDVTSDVRLEQALQTLGITDVFRPQTADFTAIIPEDTVWLDQVQHAARVAIDEEGVTAAAYTVMVDCGASPPPEDEVDLVLDRPFLFLITSQDGLPLFAGVVQEP